MSKTRATDATAESARQFILDALAAFVRDPADTDFQQGYLECLYVVGREALGMEFDGEAPLPRGPALKVVR